MSRPERANGRARGDGAAMGRGNERMQPRRGTAPSTATGRRLCALAALAVGPAWAHARALPYGVSVAVDAASPEIGPATGGTLVTLSGDGYGSGTSVACAFDDARVTPTTQSVSGMTCLTPRYGNDDGGFASIGVTLRRSGRDATTSPLELERAWTFNFAKQMTVNGAYPTDAPVHGGEVMYLTGSHMHETRTVRWTKPTTHVAVDIVSSALIRCESPEVTSGEISSYVIPTFTRTQSDYDANVQASTSANQTSSIPPRSRGAVGFVLETDSFSLTNVTRETNTTGGTPVIVTGSGFATVGADDDGSFLSCYFGTIGPIDARVVARNTARCLSPAHVDDSSVTFRLGIGNGRYTIETEMTINITTVVADDAVDDDVTLRLKNPTLDVVTGATPVDVVVGGSFFVEGSGMDFTEEDGCSCAYPDGTSSKFHFISSALARCTDMATWTTVEQVKISCFTDIDSVNRSVYVAPVAVPAVTTLYALAITYQGGVGLLIEGESFPDEGASRAYSGCHFGSIGPVHARYMSGTTAECVSPALRPDQSALSIGFGATESQDLVQYGLSIPVTSDATSPYISPPLSLTPATTYVSALSARIAVSDYQVLGSLSVGTLICTFGRNRTTTGTANAPSVNCPLPLLAPGFVVVRISRDFAAASLDPSPSILVKEDHAVYTVHPRQTWGPVDLISITGSDFLSTHPVGTFDAARSLCVFANKGLSGGVIVSSALITCESPISETSTSSERWVKPCFEECDSSTGLAVGATYGVDSDRVMLTSMVPSHLVSSDAHSGWTTGGTPVRATLSVGVPSEMIDCRFGTISVRARPVGVAVDVNVAAASNELIEIDCVSPAHDRANVTVHAVLAGSRAPLVYGGANFLYK
ncbi:hypothetical protein BE221DRAFT_192357 [Ostreococcus tauri]|uniref:IPT/TIG domain-containing protein n=1 Tax=Ostreococcus tauri TaxID=70448 RepID=A0A1Y5I9W2_OSTTA|nr:hypothetical protein BE221DRAFT_192357 [Ostreococcus tauri]